MILHKFEDWYTSKEYANFVLTFLLLLVGWIGNAVMYLSIGVGWIAPTLLAGHPHTIDDGNVIATLVLGGILSLLLAIGSVAWLYELEEHRIDKAKRLKATEEYHRRVEEHHIRQMEYELGLEQQPPTAYPVVQYVRNVPPHWDVHGRQVK